MDRWPAWKRCASCHGMDPFQLAGLQRDLLRSRRERGWGVAALGKVANLSGARRKSARPERAHLRRHRDRLPGSDWKGGGKAGLRRHRRPPARCRALSPPTFSISTAATIALGRGAGRRGLRPRMPTDDRRNTASGRSSSRAACWSRMSKLPAYGHCAGSSAVLPPTHRPQLRLERRDFRAGRPRAERRAVRRRLPGRPLRHPGRYG